MTVNDRFAFKMFLSKLKENGVLDEYIKNFMKYHGIASPALIPETVLSNANKFETAYKLRQLLLNENRTAQDLFKVLCTYFNYYAISFEWKKTDEGFSLWENIALKLSRTYDI